MRPPQPDLLALGIQQPWAELILRGVKRIEVRRVPTRVRGPIYLYASKTFSRLHCAEVTLAEQQLERTKLPLGAVVGTVEIVNCRPSESADAVAACVPA